MRTHLIALAAAALALSAATAQARPDPEVQAFLTRVQSQAESRLAGAGVNLTGHPVRLRATVDSEGRLRDVRVTGSTGSHDADYRIEQALIRMRVDQTPTQLIGANLTLALDETELAQAAH